MIEINIDPTMIAVGPLLITWHGFFSAVGLGFGLWLVSWLVRGSAVTVDDIYTGAIPAVIGGIVGARLLFVLENWWLFVDRPLGVLAINEGGISIYGAVIGGSLGGLAYALTSKRPIAFIADRAAIGLMVGQGLGRIGDIINGEHHSRAAEGLPWSVTYTHPNTLAEPGVPVHLAVGYELVYDLLAALTLFWFLKHQPRHGLTYVAYLFLYGVGRLGTGFYRKDLVVAAGLGMAQLIAIASITVAVAWFFLLWRSARQPSRAERRREGR